MYVTASVSKSRNLTRGVGFNCFVAMKQIKLLEVCYKSNSHVCHCELALSLPLYTDRTNVIPELSRRWGALTPEEQLIWKKKASEEVYWKEEPKRTIVRSLITSIDENVS